MRERLIRLESLSWPLRMILGAAMLLVVLAGVSIPLASALHQPFLDDTFGISRAPTRIPVATAFVAAAMLIFAWTLFLTGALHTHGVVRVLGLLLYTVAMGLSTVGFAYGAAITNPLALAQVVLLAVLWLRGLWLFAPRPHRRWVTFTLSLVVVTGFYALGQLYQDHRLGAHLPDALLDSGLLNYELGYLLLVPAFFVLFLSGSDFAETAQAAGDRLASLAWRRRLPWLPSLLTALCAAGLAVWLIADQLAHGGGKALAHLGEDTALALLCFGGLLLARRMALARSSRSAGEVPARALLVSALTLLGVLLLADVIAGAIAPPSPTAPAIPLTVYRHTTTAPAFSLAYPTDWQASVVSEGDPHEATQVSFTGAQGSDVGLFEVVFAPADIAQPLDADTVLGAVSTYLAAEGAPGFRFTQGTRLTDGAWQVRDVTVQSSGVALTGTAWEQASDGGYWMLIGVTDEQITHLGPTFERMARSWRFDLSAAPPPLPSDRHQTFVDRMSSITGVAFPLGFALLAGVPLLFVARRRSSAGLAASGLLFLAVGLLVGLSNLPDLVTLSGHDASFTPGLGRLSVELAAAVATLALLPWLLARGRRGEPVGHRLAVLLTLNIALLGVSLYDAVFNLSNPAPTGPRWAGLLLIGAFLWDLLTSGASATNGESRAFPRASRLLLYLGYTLYTSAFVAYYSAQTFDNGALTGVAAHLNDLPGDGLIALGMPLLITVALLRWREAGANPERAAEARVQPAVGASTPAH